EAHLSGDRDKWGSVDVRVGDARDEVRRTGPQRRKTHPRVRRETAINVRHEGRTLLVTGEDERDLVALRERGIEREGLLAGYAEDVPHAFVLEALHEQLRDVHRAASPMSRSTMTVSRHTPSSFACRRYVPTSRNP